MRFQPEHVNLINIDQEPSDEALERVMESFAKTVAERAACAGKNLSSDIQAALDTVSERFNFHEAGVQDQSHIQCF